MKKGVIFALVLVTLFCISEVYAASNVESLVLNVEGYSAPVTKAITPSHYGDSVERFSVAYGRNVMFLYEFNTAPNAQSFIDSIRFEVPSEENEGFNGSQMVDIGGNLITLKTYSSGEGEWLWRGGKYVIAAIKDPGVRTNPANLVSAYVNKYPPKETDWIVASDNSTQNDSSDNTQTNDDSTNVGSSGGDGSTTSRNNTDTTNTNHDSGDNTSNGLEGTSNGVSGNDSSDVQTLFNNLPPIEKPSIWKSIASLLKKIFTFGLLK